MEQGSWGRGQYLQLEELGCLVRAGEQINGDYLVVIHVLLSKNGEHSVYVGEGGLSVNLKGRHGFKLVLNSKPQKTKKIQKQAIQNFEYGNWRSEEYARFIE
jgi:hypothetical protein